MTLPELFSEAQTSDAHAALAYLLHQYNHLVSEYTHLASLVPGLEHSEPIGLGVDMAPATSLTGRIRNLRRRSTRGLRNDSNKAVVYPAEASMDVPNIVETMHTVSPKREGTPVHFGSQVHHHSPRIWRKSSAPSMSQRIPDSPSQRIVSRQAASPRLSTRSPTIARPQPRKPSSRPTTPLDDATPHPDVVPLAQAEVHVYGSVVRSLQGPDAVGFRVKLLPQPDVRRRCRTARAVMTWSDLVALHERLLLRTHAPPFALPDRSLFEAPYTPSRLSDRNKAVATYLRSLQLASSVSDDLLSQCFAAHTAVEPDVDPVYGTCLLQDDLLRVMSDAWLFCHCALYHHVLTIHDPSSHHQPIVFDLRRTRIGRQYEVPLHARDPNAHTTLIVLQRTQQPSSAPVKLATESSRHHSEWMSALLRESEDRSPDSAHETELFYTPKDTDEGAFPSSPRLDRPTVSVSPASDQGRSSLLSRFWYGTEPSSTALQPEKRRFLFGILPLGSSEEAPTSQSVFGMPLAEAVKHTGMSMDSAPSPVPVVIKRCIEFLDQPSVASEEGLYRVNGSMSAIKSLQDKFTASGDVDFVETQPSGNLDAHTVAGLLKMYFRALPENLCGDTLPDAMLALQSDSQDDRLCALTSVLDSLPPENYAVLCVLCKHLHNVYSFEHANKMTLQNLSIVFSATLDLPTELVLTLLQECQHLFTYPGYLVVNDYADENPPTALPERIQSMSLQPPPEPQPRRGHYQRLSDAPLYDPRHHAPRADDAHDGTSIASERSTSSTPFPPASTVAPS